MKAVILAGGRGTRGKPYTEYIHKAMTPLHGRPLIEYIIEYLEKNGITEIIVITDLAGLGGQIRDRLGHITSPRLTFVQDSSSGTGGDLRYVASIIEDDFVLWFADNMCAADIVAMAAHQKETGSLACIATRKKRREETGFASVRDGLIERFHEKPTVDLPMSECLGIYIISKKILDMIVGKEGPLNLSYDILESLSESGRVSALDIGDRIWLDIDSPVTAERYGAMLDTIIEQMGLASSSQS